MSAFIASSDTTVVLDTLVESIFIDVVVEYVVVEMPNVVVFVVDEDSDMEVVEVSVDAEDE